MEPVQSEDTFGEFEIGPNGPRPVDQVDYYLRVRSAATLRLRNRIRDVGQRWMFYTPQMQRQVVRHRIMRDQDIARSERIQEMSDNLYHHLEEDVAEHGGIQWPPPGAEVGDNEEQDGEDDPNYEPMEDEVSESVNNQVQVDEEDPNHEPMEDPSEVVSEPSQPPLATPINEALTTPVNEALVVPVNEELSDAEDDGSVHSVTYISSNTSVIDLSDDDDV